MSKEQGIYLGFDISTTCTGMSIFNQDGEFIGVKHIKIETDTDVLPENRYIAKANTFKEYIQFYKDQNILGVAIEDPLGGSNNTFTVNLLVKFNGILSYLIYQELGVIPDYVTIHRWRSDLCIEFIKQDAKGKKTLSFPKGWKSAEKKDFVFKKIAELYPSIEWLKNKKGEYVKENYDMADSVGVMLSYLKTKSII